ncbi:MAG: Acyl carrier protein [candidate division WS2 bacterium]|nr:Acyl carrier protein [Candidatus Lithacetigena glycinireducens]
MKTEDEAKQLVFNLESFERSDVFNMVKEVVIDKLGVETNIVTEEAIFIGDPDSKPPGLGADSLYLVDIIMELETVFNIRVDDEDLDKIKTVGNAVDYIYSKLKHSKQASK